jgi:DNA-binding GntR family transcriptional regulator
LRAINSAQFSGHRVHWAPTEERRLEHCEQNAEIMVALKSRNATFANEAMRNHLASRRRNYFGE